jgi:hypothetical protein
MNEINAHHPDLPFLDGADNNDDDDDDFSSNKWDTSTTGSPAVAAANMSHNTSPDHHDEHEDGFVDGFRYTKPPAHVAGQESPTRLSERSSLTGESLVEVQAAGSINMFKQQAGFHNSKPKRVVRPSQPSRNGLKAPLSPVKQQQHLPQMPNLDSISPRRQQDAVEFFGEDASSSSEAPDAAAPAPHPDADPAMEPYSQRIDSPEAGMIVGVALDVGVASGVGANLDVGMADIGLVPFVEFREKKKSQRAESVSARTESTAATTMYEEKKEENKSISPAKTVGNLRSGWETHESTQTQQAAQRLRKRQQNPLMLSKEHITRIKDQLPCRRKDIFHSTKNRKYNPWRRKNPA